MAQETLSAGPPSLESGRRSDPGRILAAFCLSAFALAFVWTDPTGKGWPAAVLIAALGLDVLGRIALRRRRGPLLAGIPSVVLASDRGMAVAVLVFALAALVSPDRFPVFSALLAGLMAMGGIARLVVAWVVLRAEREEDEA